MNLSEFIEYTRLKPDTTQDEIIKACMHSIEQGFFGICVPPYYVNAAKKTINNSKANTKIITVIGFPFGYARTSAKVEEVKQALRDGADEVDAVINIAALKSGDIATIENDISSIITTCHLQNKKAKLIFETALLSNAEIAQMCQLAIDCSADFVKTSTGMVGGTVTPAVVELLRQQLPDKILIKASGGINNYQQAVDLINAGAARLGTSKGIKTHTEK